MATVSLLATVGDLAASQTAGGISALLPSGIILPYGGATPPTGWLFCNGQSVNRTTYAGLFSAIGTAHGSGDGSTTFNVPDLRGRFVRGTDTMSQNAVTGAANRDLDRAARTAANSGGNTGDSVGSVQTNATAKNGLGSSATGVNATHNHGDSGHAHGTQQYLIPSSSFSSYTSGSYGIGASSGTATGWAQIGNQSADHVHTINTTGDNETRPLNANVNYIIKV